MSRTYKKFTGRCFRNPHGHRQAIIAGCRKRAIPPDPWDDKGIDKQCYVHYKIADGLAEKGHSGLQIVKHLMSKYKIRLDDAEDAAHYSILKRRKKTPKGLLGVYGEKEMMDL